MKKFCKICFIFVILTIMAAGTGFSKSKKAAKKGASPVPAWVTDEGRNKLFPKSEYVSAFALDASDSEVKNKAAAEISAFIKAQVLSNVQSAYSASDEDGTVSFRKDLNQNIDVTSDNAVYHLEYTVPFYSPDYGMYACVAYIKKSSAFNSIKPKLEKANQVFKKEYALALEAGDDFEKLLALERAKAGLKDFYEVYDFAMAIIPEQAAEYSKIDLLAGECQVKINQLKKNIRLLIDSEEAGTHVSDKVNSIFTENKFIVVKDGSYNYKVSVVVKNEIKKNGELYLTYPFVSVDVSKGSKTFYSFSKNLGKCAGYDEDTALRRADYELCKVLDENLYKF